MQVTHVLETHRNEDYVVGSVELGHRTGAAILRSAHSDLTTATARPYGRERRYRSGG
jgi:hydroxyacylglutathione hydrolase